MDVETLNLYGRLMEEVKFRLHFVRQACEGKLYLAQQSQIPGQMQREFAYIQLRYVMEVLAIGLVALYDNRSEVASLTTEWSANDIVKRLDRLNPGSFPVATRVVTKSDSQMILLDVDPQPLPLQDFLRVYNSLGTWLHRGTLEKISQAVPVGHVEHMRGPAKIVNDLVDHLRCHRILARNTERSYLCIIEPEPGARPRIWRALGGPVESVVFEEMVP